MSSLLPLYAQVVINLRALICQRVCPGASAFALGAYAIESVDVLLVFLSVPSFDSVRIRTARKSAGIQREGESPGCPPAHHLPRGERRSAGGSIVTAASNVITGTELPVYLVAHDGVVDTHST